MIELTLEMAETAVRAAQAKARALRAPVTVTVVLIAKGGRVIGAIGCGGGTGEQDQERADAGAAALA
jgi:uncharacterized protein GlcG (DUF336 family)